MVARLFLTVLLTLCSVFAFSQSLQTSAQIEIQGRVYVDMNNNGSFDTDDVPLSHIEVITNCANETGFASTNEEGIYRQPLSSTDVCTLSLRCQNHSADIVPQQQNVDFSQNADALGKRTYDFRILPKGSAVNNFQLQLLPLSTIETGKVARFELILQNGTIATRQETVSFSINPPFSYHSASESPTDISSESVSWLIPPMKPFQSWRSELQLMVGEPDVAFGSQHAGVFTASFSENNNEATFQYNLQSKEETSSSGISANSKNLIGGLSYKVSEIQDGSTALYLIRFQNLSDTIVQNVTIYDTLDQRLEAAAFEMVSSSHTYQIIRDAGNTIRWLFHDISLTDSLTDVDASQGYVLFKVPIVKDLFVGESVQNTAFIQFEKTIPLETNRAIFWVVDDASYFEKEKNDGIQLYPNPTFGRVFIEHPEGNQFEAVELYDMQGKLLEKGGLGVQKTTIDLSNRSKGIYLLKLIGEDTVEFRPVVRL